MTKSRSFLLLFLLSNVIINNLTTTNRASDVISKIYFIQVSIFVPEL